MAKKRKPAPKGLNIALIVGCSHDPYVDKGLWAAICDFAHILKPNVFHRNGDMFDFYQKSRFDKDPDREDTMAKDREVFFEHDDMMQKALPRDVTKIASEGNHEDRVYKYFIHHPEVRKCMKNLGMTVPTWDSFLHLGKRGYDVRATEGVRLPRVTYGDLTVWHGKKSTKYAVAHNVARMGNNACNHTHRARTWPCRVGGANMVGYELGHVADERLATDYIEDEEDWQQAFGVVYFDDTGYFDVDLVLVHDVPDTPKRRFSYKSDYWEWVR